MFQHVLTFHSLGRTVLDALSYKIFRDLSRSFRSFANKHLVSILNIEPGLIVRITVDKGPQLNLIQI